MSKTYQKVITYSSLVLFILLIILPPIIHGYIYPSVGDDSGMHLNIIKNGDLFNQLYYAYAVVGYPINWLSEVFGISVNAIFLWFNYLVLIGVGLTFWFILSRLVNWKAGLLGLFLPFFVSLGIWWQFDYGMIFNIINVGIFIPLFIYNVVKLFIDYKTWRVIPVVALIIIASLFHTSGIYLVPALFIILSAYSLWAGRNHKVNWIIVGTLITCVAIDILGTYHLLGQTQNLLPAANSESFGGELFGLDYYVNGISIVGILLIISSVYLLHKEQIELKIKAFLLVLSVLSFVLLVSTLGISPSPDRQVFDMITIISLIICSLAGLAMQRGKVYQLVVVVLVVVGMLLNINAWFSYRNTLQQPDLETIKYIQTLDVKTFNCSSEVSPIIYSQFIDAKFVDSNPEIIIERSKPMSACSNEQSIAYVPHKEVSIDGYHIGYQIEQNDIKIQVYVR